MEYLFGGSFDPVTIAHEKIINYLLNNVLKKDDKLYLLPNGDDYSFNGKKLTSYSIRRKMLETIVNDKRVIISDLLNVNSFNGVYQILETLNHPIYVIGSDLLETITTWINPEKLISENKFLVINRTSYNANEFLEKNELLKKYKKNFVLTDLTIENISSSETRKEKKYSNVSKNIYDIIVENNLYNL